MRAFLLIACPVHSHYFSVRGGVQLTLQKNKNKRLSFNLSAYGGAGVERRGPLIYKNPSPLRETDLPPSPSFRSRGMPAMHTSAFTNDSLTKTTAKLRGASWGTGEARGGDGR